jgi:hypothetical protein
MEGGGLAGPMERCRLVHFLGRAKSPANRRLKLRERPPIFLRSSLKAVSMEGDTGHKAEVGRIIEPEKAADVLIVCCCGEGVVVE